MNTRKRRYRAVSLLVCIAVLMGLFFSPVTDREAKAAENGIVIYSGTFDYTKAYEVLELVNEARQKQNLPALTMDEELLNAAMMRAGESSIYYDHKRPDGTNCFSAAPNKMNAENIGAGFSTAANVMKSWMNSTSHKNNIMNSNFKSIGIGCFYQGNTIYWVQCFGNGEAQEVTKSGKEKVTLQTTVSTAYLTSDKLSWEKKSYALEVGKNAKMDVMMKNSNSTVMYPAPDLKMDPASFQWTSSDTDRATVNEKGLVTGRRPGSVTITATLKTAPYTALTYEFNCEGEDPGPGGTTEETPGGDSGTTEENPGGNSGTTEQTPGTKPTFTSKGIYVSENDTTIVAGLVTESNNPEKIEYRWMACDENDQQWFEISGWTKGYEWVSWTPEKTGNYILVAQARVEGDESTQVEASAGVNYHKQIKGVCQMPNPDGTGYLIGLESYDNPNQELKYEMLILDCTLYRDGLPAWIYQTGQCNVPERCFWTVWQPEYGYYWTLFRIYDKNGTLLDEVCYGFVNAY